jgi:hypothetical protein
LGNLRLFNKFPLLGDLFCLLSLLLKYLLPFNVLSLHFLPSHFDFVGLLFSDTLGLLHESLLSSFSFCFFLFNFLLSDYLVFSGLSSCQLVFMISSSACLCNHLSFSFSDGQTFGFLLSGFFKSLLLSFFLCLLSLQLPFVIHSHLFSISLLNLFLGELLTEHLLDFLLLFHLHTLESSLLLLNHSRLWLGIVDFRHGRSLELISWLPFALSLKVKNCLVIADKELHQILPGVHRRV